MHVLGWQSIGRSKEKKDNEQQTISLFLASNTSKRERMQRKSKKKRKRTENLANSLTVIRKWKMLYFSYDMKRQ